ncbi:MAG TPA: IS630 family transposase [Ktedonobacteraceae bacterium]|nr:IS630 family transposase [Ktedonobacteraceae bacterium]
MDGGASPLFPPANLRADQAQETLLHLLRRDPRQLGETSTRWTLSQVLSHCQQWGWHLGSLSGLCHLLDRLHLHFKRGRDHVHSPDPLYEAKVHWLDAMLEQVRTGDGHQALLYLDELTYYRQPSIGYGYELAGSDRPYAERSYRSNTTTRVVAALDALTGRVFSHQGSKVDVDALVGLYQQIATSYPAGQRIWVVQDNWPVHFHPDVLVALEEQVRPFPFRPAPNWPLEPSERARKKWGKWRLPIQIVPLPTYASWLNPVEKLWRLLKQDVLHLHRLADDLPTLRQLVLSFLQRFVGGSLDLLRAVGLGIPP